MLRVGSVRHVQERHQKLSGLDPEKGREKVSHRAWGRDGAEVPDAILHPPYGRPKPRCAGELSNVLSSAAVIAVTQAE